MKHLRKRPPKKEMIATSLRIESGTLTKIDLYAGSIDRSRNWVVNKLLKESINTKGFDATKIWKSC